MEITYHWEGDYLIPNLKLFGYNGVSDWEVWKNEEAFFRRNHRGIYSYMILSETLWKHLAEIDEECNEMMDRLVRADGKERGCDGAAKI